MKLVGWSACLSAAAVRSAVFLRCPHLHGQFNL